jgi:hypothetical protein
MITAADLCTGDPLAPALLQAMDPAALREAFQAAMPRACVETAEIERAKYKPGAKALLSARVRLAGESAARLFAVRVLPPGKAHARYQRAIEETGPGEVLLLERIGAIAWAFPADLRITGLRYLADANLFEHATLPELAQAIAPGGAVETWSSEIAHYAAEQSCTVRVRLSGRLASGESFARILYGKCHATGESGGAVQALAEIGAALDRERMPTCGIARVILEQPQFGIQWQESAPGVQLEMAGLFDSASGLDERVGAAVAGLHGIPVKFDAPPAAPDLAKLEQRLAIAAVLPAAVRARVQALQSWLARRAPSRPHHAGLRLCHGDLHAKNMFDDGVRIHFIDFDAVHMAPPEHDAASLSAAMTYWAALQGLPYDAAAAAFARWRCGYESAGGRLNEERLAWLSVYCLLDERLYRCLTRLKPGRRAIAEALVVQAERVVQRRSGRDV